MDSAIGIVCQSYNNSLVNFCIIEKGLVKVIIFISQKSSWGKTNSLDDKEHYDALQTDLKEIKTHVKNITVPNEALIYNKQFTKLMSVSFRTAQTWRGEGEIGFSQEGKKSIIDFPTLKNS
jgi:hypothetical protein